MATDRLLATAWRFEINKGHPNAPRFKQDAIIAVCIFLITFALIINKMKFIIIHQEREGFSRELKEWEKQDYL